MSDVVVVCTANVARSPLFAARLRLEADRRLGLGTVEVSSAGVDALFGMGAAGHAIEIAAGWGSDLRGHTATPTSYLDLNEPALIVTMERAHRDRIRATTPGATTTTFTLLELVMILEERLPDAAVSDVTAFDTRAHRERIDMVVSLADRHRPARLPRKRADIPDPVHGSRAVYEALGERFEVEARVLADVLFGPRETA